MRVEYCTYLSPSSGSNKIPEMISSTISGSILKNSWPSEPSKCDVKRFLKFTAELRKVAFTSSGAASYDAHRDGCWDPWCFRCLKNLENVIGLSVWPTLSSRPKTTKKDTTPMSRPMSRHPLRQRMRHMRVHKHCERVS